MTIDNPVMKKVKRSNRMTLILGMIGLLIVGAGAFLFSVPYWVAHLSDPVEISSTDVLMLNGSERLYNRAVSGEDMDDTYYYEEITENGIRVRIDAYFGALEIGKDQWLFVRTPDEINTREEDYVGNLEPLTFLTGSVTREVYELAADEMNIDFLPFVLDTTGDEMGWYIGGTVALILLALASIWGVFVGIKRTNDPYKHPILKKLSRFGNVNDLMTNINNELNTGADKIGKLKFTRNYVINDNGNTFDVIPYDALAWAYKFIQRGRYNTKTYQAHVYDVTGYQMTINAKEKDVMAMLEAIAARAPWLFKGYSDDFKKAWQKDRQGIVADLNQRRKEYHDQR
ncbi:MAG: DUF6709 family protein [Phototrophicaceae bacterium]